MSAHWCSQNLQKRADDYLSGKQQGLRSDKDNEKIRKELDVSLNKKKALFMFYMCNVLKLVISIVSYPISLTDLIDDRS